jgi:hypothetical protein
MIWQTVRKYAGIVLATVAALFVFILLEVVYVRTLGRMYFLTGIPTPGGAPLGIHVLNMGLKGGYSALAYALVMRLWFGRVFPRRVAALWLIGLIIVAIFGYAAMKGLMSPQMAGNIGLLAFLVISLVIARDWVSR